MDWKDTTRVDRFEYELLDPNDIDTSRGFLAGVTSCTITLGYYTDTRVSASITCVNPDYIENSLIRVHHYVDAENYHNELGTFFVDSIEPTFRNGAGEYQIECSSLLARVSEDYLEKNLAIPSGKSAMKLLEELFELYGIDYRFNTTYGATYKDNTVFEVGENVLLTLMEIADKANARLTIDGHGVVHVEQYINPGEREQVCDIDPTMIVGDISESMDFYSLPNRAVVHSKKNDSVVSGYADTPSTSATSRSRRGRRITKVYNVNDLEPLNGSHASDVAKTYLDGIDDLSAEVSCNTLYIPLDAGEVVNLIYNGMNHNAMLKTRDIECAPGMPCSDTFKVV